jgi:hypothetical protein
MQVPHHLLRELSRKHPTVSIVWAPQTKQWILVHHDGAGSQFVHAFSGRPTRANTVMVLDAAHHSRWVNDRAVDEKLQALDQSHVDPNIEYERKERINEGSDALFNRLTKRRVFTV